MNSVGILCGFYRNRRWIGDAICMGSIWIAKYVYRFYKDSIKILYDGAIQVPYGLQMDSLRLHSYSMEILSGLSG